MKSLTVALLVVIPALTAAQTQPASMLQHAALSATAPAPPTADMPATDLDFINMAAQTGETEIALGKLALQKAGRTDVRDFAQRMVNDHSKAAEKLKQIAEAKKIKLPTSPSENDAKEMTRLERLSGADFDREYIANQRAAHREAVELFTKQKDIGKDPALKAFASATLPTLEEHDRVIKAMPAN